MRPTAESITRAHIALDQWQAASPRHRSWSYESFACDYYRVTVYDGSGPFEEREYFSSETCGAEALEQAAVWAEQQLIPMGGE